MDIATFDQLDEERATAVLLGCAAVPRWADEVSAKRPFGSVVALLTTAEEFAEDWTGTEVERALADHPRIGERHQGSGASAAHSRSEQAGVGDDADVTARLAAGNAAYEQRFDRIYLVRAKGRSAEEILALLEQRLGNDPDTELVVTAGQLREIALLRLADEVTP